MDAWRDFDYRNIAILAEEMISDLQKAGNEIAECISKLEYEPVTYKYDNNTIEVNSEPGFGLVKDSYFPYWNIEQGDIVSTSQGFMLVYTNDTTTKLHYQKPAINTIASFISVAGFVTVLVTLIIMGLKRRIPILLP